MLTMTSPIGDEPLITGLWKDRRHALAGKRRGNEAYKSILHIDRVIDSRKTV